METRLLKMFCAVAETGSLVTAGRKLHLTASALSHSLKALETDLGCRLFERVGKRMVLNQAGEELLAQVRGSLAALESAVEGRKRPPSALHSLPPRQSHYPAAQELFTRFRDDTGDYHGSRQHPPVQGIGEADPRGLGARAMDRRSRACSEQHKNASACLETLAP